MEEIMKELLIESPEILAKVFGQYDENIKMIEGRLNIDVIVRDNTLKIRGGAKAVDAGIRVVEEMVKTVAVQGTITKDTTDYILQLEAKGLSKEYGALREDTICFTTRGKPIRSKTIGQSSSSPRRCRSYLIPSIYVCRHSRQTPR